MSDRGLEDALPGASSPCATERWEYLRDTVYNAAVTTFGKRKGKTNGWFEAHSKEIIPVIEENRRALASYKNLHTLRVRAARSKFQQTARLCANDNWLQLCSQIQFFADVGNTKRMYTASSGP